MSLQTLGPKKLRRLARDTGLPVIHGVARGGYTLWFVTEDHQHGWWNLKTGTWGLQDDDPSIHWSSCHRRWPDTPPWYPRVEQWLGQGRLPAPSEP